MQLDHLHQAPFSSTFMGAVRGALDHYGIGVTDAFTYGASGHAFAMNIHNQLCPSGPYCFDRAPIFALLENVGLHTASLGFFHAGSAPNERDNVETQLRDALESREPCMLINMEFQLITACDDTGFRTAQPWPGHDFPPARLTYGTWSELGDEVHINFYVFRRGRILAHRAAAQAALAYAVDLWRNPATHSAGDYGMGPDAYANWKSAVEAGHGTGHGCWWNGMVWSESRTRAAEYLREIAPLLPDPSAAAPLADHYAAIGSLLQSCADKETAPEAKLAHLSEAEAHEMEAISRIEAILRQMG